METPIAFDALALGRLPERHARYRPRHTAVIAPSGDRDVRLSWRELDAYVNRWANALAAQGTTMFPAFMQGATFIVHRRFDAEAFIDTVERERVTHTMLVPSQIIAILNARGFDPARLVSLEMLLSLGAPLHREHKARLHRLLPDRIYELYGLTEGFVTILDRDEALHKAGSVGVPPPFYEMRIVDDDGRELPANATGEIVGRGPITMPGYYGRDDLTAAALRDGWRDWINARVAAKYQRVAQVIVYEDFPRSAAGKTLKREMRAPFWKGRDRAI